MALLLIPGALAYAEIAGMPPTAGLWAASVAPIAASFFASSAYLQTGPVAVTSLLTLGALIQLAPTGSAQYVGMAGLLALVVGVSRVLIGVLRVGALSYLMSQPVISGFMSAAALLIMASQLPNLLGVPKEGAGVLEEAWGALSAPSAWHAEALVISAIAISIILFARRISPMVPGVLIAAIGALLYSRLTGYGGPTVGALAAGLPSISLNLPWSTLPVLLVPGLVIALVGFADAAAISRTFATQDRTDWSPDREFIGQGAANLASGLVGGYPVGGSFARSSLNRLSGARSRRAGLYTGLIVLAFLPFADVVAPLPSAILGAIVTTSVWGLFDPKGILRIARQSGAQGFVAATTFVMTLLLAPRIDLAVLIGIGLSLAVHAYREFQLQPNLRVVGDVIEVAPQGVLWFVSAPLVEAELVKGLAEAEDARLLRVDLSGLGRIDLSGALALRRIMDDAHAAGLETEVLGIPDHAAVLVERVLTKGVDH